MKPHFYYSNFWSDFNLWLKEKAYTLIVILCDENTHESCVPAVLSEIEAAVSIEIIEIESGELHKNIDTCQKIWNALTDFRADRKSLLLNIGGGVITDMGGFVASTYLRGIDFVNFPTTLLSMVDASVGGKTGVDLGIHKNRIGTFTVAQQTFVYPDFLQTLEQSEILSGFAEMLKHGLIASKSHFKDLKSLKSIEASSLKSRIETSVMIKYEIVQKDPKERGLRKILNFGHTIGHAIESYHLANENPILHGFAVGIGMYYETELAFQIGMLSEEDKKSVQQTLDKWYLIPTYNEAQIKVFIELMKSDKKNVSQELNFALIDEIGHCQYDIQVDEKRIQEALKS